MGLLRPIIACALGASQNSPSTTCAMTTPGCEWRPALNDGAISTVA